MCMVLISLNIFIFVYTGSGCVSISKFATLVGVPVSIVSTAAGLITKALAARIKKYKLTIKKKRKNHNKIVLTYIMTYIWLMTYIMTYINTNKFVLIS